MLKLYPNFEEDVYLFEMNSIFNIRNFYRLCSVALAALSVTQMATLDTVLGWMFPSLLFKSFNTSLFSYIAWVRLMAAVALFAFSFASVNSQILMAKVFSITGIIMASVFLYHTRGASGLELSNIARYVYFAGWLVWELGVLYFGWIHEQSKFEFPRVAKAHLGRTKGKEAAEEETYLRAEEELEEAEGVRARQRKTAKAH